MKVSNSVCACGNILIKGQLVSKCSNHDINAKMSKMLYSIDFQSMEILNFQRATRYLLNKTASKVKCMICETTFHFFLNNLQLYLEKTQPINNSCNHFQSFVNLNQTQKINSYVIILLSNLFKPSAFIHKKMEKVSFQKELYGQLECNKFSDDDTDFDIMFSNKYDPFVGSYKQQDMVIPTEK